MPYQRGFLFSSIPHSGALLIANQSGHPLLPSPPMAEKEMSFLDHLEELRWHLIRMAVVVVIAAGFAFFRTDLLFETVLFGPKSSDFVTYRFFCALSQWLSGQFPALFPDGAICIGQHFPPLVNLTMAGQFTTHIVSAIIAGLVVAFPYIVWEFWRFVRPGLSPAEQRNARWFTAAVSFLFFAGAAFGYFVIAPLSVHFFMNYAVSPDVVNSPTLDNYISLVTTIVLSSGAVFELPVLVYFLARMGVVSAKWLRAFRRHALVAALILAAIITPPDVFSQVLVTIPILVLYEVSIGIAALVDKRR